MGHFSRLGSRGSASSCPLLIESSAHSSARTGISTKTLTCRCRTTIGWGRFANTSECHSILPMHMRLWQTFAPRSHCTELCRVATHCRNAVPRYVSTGNLLHRLCAGRDPHLPKVGFPACASLVGIRSHQACLVSADGDVPSTKFEYSFQKHNRRIADSRAVLAALRMMSPLLPSNWTNCKRCHPRCDAAAIVATPNENSKCGRSSGSLRAMIALCFRDTSRD